MKLQVVLIVVLFFTNVFSQEKDLTGSWFGKLKLPSGVTLTVVFNLQIDNGKYLATLDSPDQGAKGIPCGEVKVEGDSVSIDVPLVVGSYSGIINRQTGEITGIWSQSGSSFELNLQYTKEYAGPKRPQEPKPPFPYNSEDVKFSNNKDNIVLAGTITYPKEKGEYPAVILISGSGAQNRDEEIFNHKPFLIISDFLTRNNFVVLRFDDRGVGESEGDHTKATTFDFAEDVKAAVNFLKSRDEVDKKKIGLIGHSEGAMIASIVASESDDISFVVMMAGPGVSGDSLLYLQTELIYRSEGQSEDKIQQILKNLREVYSIVKSDEEEDVIKILLREKYYKLFEQMTDDEKKQYGDPEVYMEMEIRLLTSPWFRNFLKFDPAVFISRIKCPVLAINGEKDLQVPSKQNLPAIENALKRSGNQNFEIIELPQLNHLFQTSEFGTIAEYGAIEETVSPVALQTILAWLKKVTK